MKKRTLIVAALLAAMTVSANAQENLALGKTATASSSEGAYTPDKAIDGTVSADSRWAYSGEKKGEIEKDNTFWFQVDLTQEDNKTVDFNCVQILWENDNVKRFKLLTSNNGTDWKAVYEQTEDSDNSGTKTYTFDNINARYIRLKATKIDNYFSFYEFRVFQKAASVLTSVKPNVAFVKTNEPTDVSFTYADQYGEEMTCNGATFDITGGTYDGSKLTATTDGKVTIKATYNGSTVETNVYAVSKAPELNLDKTKNAYYGIYGADALNCETTAAWTTQWNNNGTSSAIKLLGEMTIDGTKAIHVGNIQKLLIGKSTGNGGTGEWGLANTNEYTDATVALFPDRDVHAYFTIEGENVGSVAKDLKGGEWNYITVSGLTAASKFTYFDILADAVNGEYPNMLISNVYLSKNIETSVLTSAEANTAFVREGVASDLALTYYDQKGQTMENPDVTIKSDDGTWAGGKFTANKSGNITVNVLSGDQTVATLSFYAMANDAVPTLNTEDYLYKGIYAVEPYNDYNDNVSWHATWSDDKVLDDVFTIDDTPARQIVNFKHTYILQKDGNNTVGKALDMTNEDGYTDMVMSVFTDRDINVTFLAEGVNHSKSFDLVGGKWNQIVLPGFSSTDGAISYINLISNNPEIIPNLLITNVALRKVNPNTLIIGSEEDATKGFVKVEGSVTTGDHLKTLESEDYKDVTAFDLSNVTFGNDVTSLNVANKNAMIQVAGTVENGVATIAESAKAIENTPNLVVENGGYYFPVKQLQLVDGYTAYTSFIISTGNVGYKYTRNVEPTTEGGKWISITSPVDITNIPEGIIVYEGVADETEEKTISFNKVTTIEKNKPYIAWAKDNVTLEGEGISDLDMELYQYGTTDTPTAKTVDMGNGIKFHANYIPVSGEGKKYYGIYKGTTGETLTLKRIGETAKLGSFRAYLEMPESTTEADVQMLKVKVSDGIVNSIYRVETEGSKASATGVYSLDGRLVRLGNSTEDLEKGVYVVNGKKVVVK